MSNHENIILDPSITVETTPSETRYILPNRKRNYFGIIGIILGGILLSISGYVILDILWLSQDHSTGSEILYVLAFVLFLGIFGVALLALGLSVLYPNHTEIILQKNALIFREVRIPKNCALSFPVRSIMDWQLVTHYPNSSPLKYEISIQIKYQRFQVAAGYPKEILFPIAHRIVAEYFLSIPLALRNVLPLYQSEIPNKPPNTSINLVQTEDRKIITFDMNSDVIVATKDKLIKSKSSMLITSKKNWDRTSLQSIQTIFTYQDDRPQPELRLYFKNGKSKILLSYYSADELEWIAAHLRQTLNLPAQ